MSDTQVTFLMPSDEVTVMRLLAKKLGTSSTVVLRRALMVLDLIEAIRDVDSVVYVKKSNGETRELIIPR